MKISFPFEYIGRNRFGKIFRPKAIISVYKKDIDIFVKKSFVVDSGADITIFPRKDAGLFGINLEKETVRDKTSGIGGEETIYLYNGLEVKLGDIKLKIPVGFIDRNDVPALLGRQHFMELFKTTFSNHQTTFEK